MDLGTRKERISEGALDGSNQRENTMRRENATGRAQRGCGGEVGGKRMAARWGLRRRQKP
jgi:hypothetical protein